MSTRNDITIIQDGAETIPFNQSPPTPLMSRLLYLPIGAPTATADVRLWADGDMERCKLCRHCTGAQNVCLVGINRIVPRSEAATLSDRDCDWIAEPGQLAGLMGRTS